MTRTKLVGLLLASCMILGGCVSQTGSGSTSTRAIASAIAPTLAQIVGEWKLVIIEGHPVAEPLTKNPPTLSITSDGKASGFAGVNRYFGSINPQALESGKFSLTGMGMTRMASMNPALMKLESDFSTRLTSADTAKLLGDRLILSRAATPVLEFQRIPPKTI